MHRTYRYRLYPTRRQREALELQLRFACDLYNAALEQRRDAWRRCGASVNYHAQSAQLTQLRNARPELLPPSGMNAWSQQAVLRRLDRAFEAFFRRAKRGERPGYPRFKPASRFDTLTWTLKGNAGGVVITEQGRLRLQGVGCVKVKWHRKIPTEAVVGEVRVTRKGAGSCGRFYVSIGCELPDPPARPGRGEAVGLDLGIRCLAALSTGERFQGPYAGSHAAPSARRAARRIARRKRGSKRRAKAALHLARVREREANRRRDVAHKLSRSFVDRFDLIAYENLVIANMVRSTRGTLEAPGRGVAAKAALNREIADAAWGTLLSFLAYKAEEAGRRVVKVDPAYTSQSCAACGAVDARSRRSERFRCIVCAHTDDADVNAAKVILQRALAAPRGGREQARTGPSGRNSDAGRGGLRSHLFSRVESSHLICGEKA